MTKDILVNRVDIELNHKSIDRDFDVLKISTDLIGKQNFGKVVNKIYQTLLPLSLCSLEKGKYAILMPKGRQYSLNDPHFTVSRIGSADLGKSSCAKLLIGAMPHLINDHNRSSEGVGLYYLSDVETIRGVEVLRTFEVKLEWEQQKHLVLTIAGATFTPVHYHTNAEGQLYGDCTHLPRVRFDRWSQELTRSSNGEFIKKKHRDKKMSSEVVSLDTKNPSKFWRSKMGILAMFMNDVERHLGEYITINFHSLGPEYRVRFKETDVKKTYQTISELLTKKEINLINMTDADMSPLLNALTDEGLTVQQSNGVIPDALNFAVHHEKEYYESIQQVDPYSQLRTSEDVIIQSVYPETVLKEGKLVRTTYEACKKELFVKWEVADRQLKLVTPNGNWLFIVCNAPKDEEAVFYTLSCRRGQLTYAQIGLNEAQDSFLLDLPRSMKNEEHAVINLDTNDTFILEETRYVALPQFSDLAQVMNELAYGYANGVQRVWICEFLDLMKDGFIEVTNKELVESRLSILLSQKPHLETFYKKDIFGDQENKIAYKGSLQSFFDWIATEKGLRLGASLKGQDNGYIEASLGLFYNEDERLYFVGDKDNVKSIPKFCRMRRILTDAETVPTELLKMMEVFHIRHKQATIYPFLFKHLREFAQANSA